MTVARFGDTATLLTTGSVLVAGGFSGTDSTTSAEVYDPNSGTWMATGSMISDREFQTATLLRNGKVLVAGGFKWSTLSALAAAELYDPVSGAWMATGSMNAARNGHSAVLLPNGEVLVAGGFPDGGASGSLSTAELYDPDSGTWAPTGSMSTGRERFTLTLLTTGKVLAAGVGAGTAELYDPSTGQWTLTGSLSVSRESATATLLPGGQVLVAGGTGPPPGLWSSAELYDPSSGTWTLTGSMANGRYGHAAGLLNSGAVLVAGGSGPNPSVWSTSEIFHPDSGTWSNAGTLIEPRPPYLPAALLPDGKVLLAGGGNNQGQFAQVWFPGTAADAPSAALLTTPSLAMVGLPVTADSSLSRDVDASPIANYTFNYGDGNVAGPQAANSATHSYAALGNYKVSVTVTDAGGLSSSATATVAVRPNLVANPGFETDTSGWNSASVPGVTLSRVSGGHSGNWSAALTNGGTAPASCVLNDSPNWVRQTMTGTHVGSLWARADTAGAGLKLKFREYGGSTLLGSAVASATLTTSWQLVSVSYAPVAAGSSTLDFQAFVSSAPVGNCFYVDDVGIALLPGPDLAPSAVLSVAPAWGVATLTVTADASGATDLDATPIASHVFNFGDGTVVGPQVAASASHTYSFPGAYVVTDLVADSAGSASRAAVTVVVDGPPVLTVVGPQASGPAPLPVVADASLSLDDDATPIATYRFDFGDGTLVGPGPLSAASHTYTVPGTYSVAITATDTAGISSTTNRSVTVLRNLVGNSGFETDTSGWNTAGGTGVTLSRIAGGFTGSWSAQLTNSGSQATSCTLNDSPNWVSKTTTGTYQGSIWVRADVAGATLKLKFREYSGSTLVGSSIASITLATYWAPVTVTYVPLQPGLSSLDFTVSVPNSQPGTCFYADYAAIVVS